MFKKPKVAFLMIATNKYIKFANSTIQSADQHFLPHCDVTYCIFTNHKAPTINTNREYSLLNIVHEFSFSIFVNIDDISVLFINLVLFNCSIIY